MKDSETKRESGRRGEERYSIGWSTASMAAVIVARPGKSQDPFGSSISVAGAKELEPMTSL